MLITAVSLFSDSWRRERSQRPIKRRMKWRRSRGRGGRRWPREEKSTSRGFSGKVMEKSFMSDCHQSDMKESKCFQGACLNDGLLLWITSGKLWMRLAERCGYQPEPTGKSARNQALLIPTTWTSGRALQPDQRWGWMIRDRCQTHGNAIKKEKL